MRDLPIGDYDLKPVEEILENLHGLDRSDLLKIENFEKNNQNRTVIIEAIQAELKGPIRNYNELPEDEIINRLDYYCRKDLEAIANYERNHQERKNLLNAVYEKMPELTC